MSERYCFSSRITRSVRSRVVPSDRARPASWRWETTPCRAERCLPRPIACLARKPHSGHTRSPPPFRTLRLVPLRLLAICPKEYPKRAFEAKPGRLPTIPSRRFGPENSPPERLPAAPRTTSRGGAASGRDTARLGREDTRECIAERALDEHFVGEFPVVCRHEAPGTTRATIGHLSQGQRPRSGCMMLEFSFRTRDSRRSSRIAVHRTAGGPS